ncbi:MAG: DUF4349 domain-containing protein [Prevotella sp.]|nr:DUF4349 domain-containing protein [Prevotella sp.]
MKKVTLLLLVLSLFFIWSCGNKANESSVAMDEVTELSELKTPQADAKKEAKLEDKQASEYDRKITKTGDINFETKDIVKTKSAIQKQVKALKGYIESDEISTYDERKSNTLTIRIPSSSFDTLINNVAEQATKIDSREVRLSDVTEEYIDLDKRLKTKKELEARYIQLLQKATKVEEILKIEEQMGKLREDIESTEGRFRYLNGQVDYSTLNVTFYESNPDYNFWNRIGNGFSNGWETLLTFVVMLANLWAVILLATGIIFFIRYWRKKRKNRITNS